MRRVTFLHETDAKGKGCLYRGLEGNGTRTVAGKRAGNHDVDDIVAIFIDALITIIVVVVIVVVVGIIEPFDTYTIVGIFFIVDRLFECSGQESKLFLDIKKASWTTPPSPSIFRFILIITIIIIIIIVIIRGDTIQSP